MAPLAAVLGSASRRSLLSSTRVGFGTPLQLQQALSAFQVTIPSTHGSQHQQVWAQRRAFSSGAPTDPEARPPFPPFTFETAKEKVSVRVQIKRTGCPPDIRSINLLLLSPFASGSKGSRRMEHSQPRGGGHGMYVPFWSRVFRQNRRRRPSFLTPFLSFPSLHLRRTQTLPTATGATAIPFSKAAR